MIDQPNHVCTVCGEDFHLSGDRVGDRSWILTCPCCGSTELLRVAWDDEPARLTAA